MSLEQLENALISLEGWPTRVGIIGGEPTLHPEFREACQMLLKYGPKERYGLWTTGGPLFRSYKGLIDETFGMLAYNQHTEYQQSVCKHQPITIAINEVVEDHTFKKQLIDDCWVQKTWCPSIGPKGSFFCEVAYAIDSLLDMQGGYKIEPGWWIKEPEDFKDQVDRYCGLCGMAVPIQRQVLKYRSEFITPKLYKRFKKLNLANIKLGEDIVIFDRKLSIEDMLAEMPFWDPGNYRGDICADRKK